NPIKLVWHAMNEFVRHKAKPKNKDKLLVAVVTLWFDRLICLQQTLYIEHLQKVLPPVVQRNGDYTGM
ncbi:MAG: hypothetical protein ACRDDA_04740, partial [Aeromonas sp.]